MCFCCVPSPLCDGAFYITSNVLFWALEEMAATKNGKDGIKMQIEIAELEKLCRFSVRAFPFSDSGTSRTEKLYRIASDIKSDPLKGRRKQNITETLA